MKSRNFLSIAVLALILVYINVDAQKITIRGKITDATTGDPVTYASVAVKGTSIGTNTNFDGNYRIAISIAIDSLTVSSIGYVSQSFYVKKNTDQVLNIRLRPSVNLLTEVRITPKGYVNPAWAILKQVMIHKPANDPQKLSSYQYHSYSRIELDASHISKKLLDKKFMNKALSIAGNLNLTDDDRIPVLPIFLSETVSDYYYQRSPEAKHENINRIKTNGIGFEDGTVLAQLTGSTFFQYNFYKDHISAAGKDFISPVTDNWKLWYDYELEKRDELLNGKLCYQISFKPKRPQDLAFTGTIWIAKDNYALVQIKATIGSSANLNFISQIAIQQQMGTGKDDEPWMPVKTRILVNVNQLTKNSSGLLAKFYTVNTNVLLNKSYPSSLFKENITIADNAHFKDNQFWDANRPDSLTLSEKSVYGLIDTIKDIPVVKSYLTIADLIINGYYRDGKIGIGPLINSYALNNIEGNRIRLGFKTNSDFSNKVILGGYLAFGTKDKALKFGGSADYILSRRNWTEAGISYSHDLNQVALLSDSYLYQRNNLFSAFTRFGQLDKRKVFWQNLTDVYIRRDLFKGFTEKVTYTNWTMDPLFQFRFMEPGSAGYSNILHVSELQFETVWSPGSQPLRSETINRQVSVKENASSPVFTFHYTRGLKDFLGGDFAYNKFSINVTQTLKLGALGRGKYSFSAGYIPSTIPFPLLENHLGNQTFIYNYSAFNLMNFFEFASDKYASINYTQHFEGLLFNSIPLIRDLKWRLVGTTNILYGGLSQANKALINDSQTTGLHGLGNTPYVEAGYGIENIFKFFRVDFIHRLTYRDNTNASDGTAKNFGIKLSAQIRL